MPDHSNKPGLLLVGHGTRSERGTVAARKLAALVAAPLAPAAVELAFLELQEPTIAAGLDRLAERGARQVVALPLLLFSAGHDQRDIPAAIRAWGGLNEINVVLADHLGCHPALVELAARRFTEALQGRPIVTAEDTVLVFVGRGSRDAGATAEMHEFASQLADCIEVGETQVAFLAMAEPSAAEVLRQLARRAVQGPRRNNGVGIKRVVIQPHLLFHGDLVESLHEQVRAVAAAQPQVQWLVAPLLADDLGNGSPAEDFLARVVVERYHAAGIRIVAEPTQD